MEQYIGHIITVAIALSTGGIAFGVLKNQVAGLFKNFTEYTKRLDSYSERIRQLESDRSSIVNHINEAPNVLDRLRGIENELKGLSIELKHRDAEETRIRDVMEANRMVLMELSERLIRMEAKGNGGG